MGTQQSTQDDGGDTVTMRIGNTAEYLPGDNCWRWSVFLEAGPAAVYIESVRLELHPTFNPSSYTYRQPDSDGTFRSGQFTGWGTFNVELHLSSTAGGSYRLTHHLDFSDGGASRAVQVQLPAGPQAGAAQSAGESRPPLPNADLDLPLAAPADLAPAVVTGVEVDRAELQLQLSGTPFLEPDDPRFFHGRAFNGTGAERSPECTWQSPNLPRDDHGSTADWLTASEFADHEEVIEAKCAALAQLLLLSHKTVVYSGAGISVAALIGQAARGSGGQGSKGTDAWPTKTHFALGALGRAGLLQGWVQQNHDGLPQKAGFPQEHINEIHGSWFDPSNPVVLYSGSLKGDAYPQMRHDAATADLVVVVGTSLGGLNADQVATRTADRSLRDRPWQADGRGGALGTVIINLQQTEQDGKATLRLFGTTDSVLPRVLEKLGLAEIVQTDHTAARFCREPNGYMYDSKLSRWHMRLPDERGQMQPVERPNFTGEERVVVVPYDRDGNRSSTAEMVLDLRNGTPVRITDGHNIQGAGQPHYLHIGADEPYTRPKAYGGQTLQNGPGHGKVLKFSPSQSAFVLEIEGVQMLLGAWWLEAAQRGNLETLPIVNLNPEMR